MSQQELQLPRGWVKISLEHILESLESGKRPKGGVKKSTEGIPSLGGEHLNDQGGFKFEKIKFVTESFFKTISHGRIKLNDVLVVKDGATTGKVSFVKRGFPYAVSAVNEHVFILRGHPSLVIPEFMFYYLFSLQGQELIKSKTSGLIGGINTSFVNEFTIPICSLNEQKRIKSKIEKLFTKIDSTHQSLENTKIQLYQYKQSLLKSAFEGKLTEEWRTKNNISLDMLLEKIKINRKNQEPKLQKLKPFTDNAPFSIPSNWVWTRVGIMSNKIQYGTSEKASTEKSQIPVLRMGNIQEGILNFEKLKYYSDNWKSCNQYLLKDGDVLFNRTNSAELVGKSAMYQNFHPPAVFAGYLIRVKILDEIYFPYLLTCYLNSIFGKSYVRSVVTQQVGQANVNGTKLAMMPIPLMSNEEQEQIMSQIEQGFTLIKKISQIVESTLQQLQTMKMSILKQAFEGKLVAQDPNDESASVLLERIKNIKDSQPTKQREMKNVK
jgi:type I restriction enzyme, S subunit